MQWVCRNRDSEPISGLTACVNAATGRCCKRGCRWTSRKLWHIAGSKRRCWSPEKTTKCLWQEASTLRQRQQNSTFNCMQWQICSIRILTIKDYSAFCTVETNYWQTRSIARPLCESRATCHQLLIMKDTPGREGRLDWALILLGLALSLPSTFVSVVFVVLYTCNVLSNSSWTLNPTIPFDTSFIKHQKNDVCQKLW